MVNKEGRAGYDAVKDEYKQTTSEGREICLEALGQTSDEALARDFAGFIFSKEVAIQDNRYGAISLAGSDPGRHILWQFVVHNWDVVYAVLGPIPVLMARFIQDTLPSFATYEMEQSIREFFQDKDSTGWDRPIAQVLDSVKTRAKYRERDEKLLLEWLTVHGYSK